MGLGAFGGGNTAPGRGPGENHLPTGARWVLSSPYGACRCWPQTGRQLLICC